MDYLNDLTTEEQEQAIADFVDDICVHAKLQFSFEKDDIEFLLDRSTQLDQFHEDAVYEELNRVDHRDLEVTPQRYSNSWFLIMPVFEKVQQMAQNYNAKFVTENGVITLRFQQQGEDVEIVPQPDFHEPDTLIDRIFYAVLKFIQYYEQGILNDS